MTLAATVDKFVHRQQWMDRHGGRESLGYWDEEGVCKSAEPSRGRGKSPTMVPQRMVNASKCEVYFHVESQASFGASDTLPSDLLQTQIHIAVAVQVELSAFYTFKKGFRYYLGTISQ
jgi:hypothetical protein